MDEKLVDVFGRVLHFGNCYLFFVSFLLWLHVFGFIRDVSLFCAELGHTSKGHFSETKYSSFPGNKVIRPCPLTSRFYTWENTSDCVQLDRIHIFNLAVRFGIFQNLFSLSNMKSLTHIHVQHPNFSIPATFHNLSVSDFNFMGITNLKIYKGIWP